MVTNACRLLALMTLGLIESCGSDARTEAPARFFHAYATQLAQWHGDGCAFVTARPSQCTRRGPCYVLTCRNEASGITLDTRIEFGLGAGGLLESLTFNRDFFLPNSTLIRQGVPVPIESVMRALRMTAHAATVEPAGMVVKKLREKASVRKSDAEKFRIVRKINGFAPTALSDFNGVRSFTIGVFNPDATECVFHTFACDPNYIAGRNGDRYATVFMLAPDLGLTRPVARFNARIRRGRVKFVYKAWFPNPQEFLIDQASYDAARMVLKTNRPVAGVSFSGVHFAMDGESNVVDDVPMLIKLRRAGMSARSVKLLNPPD